MASRGNRVAVQHAQIGTRGAIDLGFRQGKELGLPGLQVATDNRGHRPAHRRVTLGILWGGPSLRSSASGTSSIRTSTFNRASSFSLSRRANSARLLPNPPGLCPTRRRSVSIGSLSRVNLNNPAPLSTFSFNAPL